METAIKPIETVYNGYRFRSRLEARWAVFFDSLGVRYEYEPEGFRLPDGTMYLPDFRVMCHGTRGGCADVAWPLYVEVKGQMDEASAEKIKNFSNYCGGGDTNNLAILIVSDIPNVQSEYDVIDSQCMGSYDCLGFDLYPFNYETIDGDHFAAYPAADEKGRFYLMGDDCHYINADDCPRVMRAYQAARQARFEHGESPNRRRP